MKRISFKRHVDPNVFKTYISSQGLSIRQLGIYIDCNEKTIRRMLKDEEVTLNVALSMIRFFECTFDDIFGVDDSPDWAQAKELIFNSLR